jgi:hypothetical protein
MSIPGFTADASLKKAANKNGRNVLATLDPFQVFTLAQSLSPTAIQSLISPQQQQEAENIGRTAQQLQARLKVYGNWCGPGHSGPGAPVDPVDQVCCKHDKCYSSEGYLDCKCDRDLVRRLPAAMADRRTSASGVAWGAAAIALFTATPCLCHKGCLPLIGCHDLPGETGVPGIPGLKRCPPGFK